MKAYCPIMLLDGQSIECPALKVAVEALEDIAIVRGLPSYKAAEALKRIESMASKTGKDTSGSPDNVS